MNIDLMCAADARDKVVNHVLETEVDFVVTDIPNYRGSTRTPEDDFRRWALWVLRYTAFGAAMILFHKHNHHAIEKDLRETWDDNQSAGNPPYSPGEPVCEIPHREVDSPGSG